MPPSGPLPLPLGWRLDPKLCRASSPKEQVYSLLTSPPFPLFLYPSLPFCSLYHPSLPSNFLSFWVNYVGAKMGHLAVGGASWSSWEPAGGQSGARQCMQNCMILHACIFEVPLGAIWTILEILGSSSGPSLPLYPSFPPFLPPSLPPCPLPSHPLPHF